MSYDVPRMAGDAAWTEHDADDHARRPGDEGSGPMWEVFVRQRRGMPSSAVTASDPDNAASMFEPFAEQPYRHATYYDIPDEVGHM
jgi:1,2-phenylacetyl-CoA epoxidase PaaB subunit